MGESDFSIIHRITTLKIWSNSFSGNFILFSLKNLQKFVWYNVEYEGHHLLLSTCGCYGHIGRNCTTLLDKNSESKQTKVATLGDKAADVTRVAETTMKETILEAINSSVDKLMIAGEIPTTVITEIKCPRKNRRGLTSGGQRKKNLNSKNLINAPLNLIQSM